MKKRWIMLFTDIVLSGLIILGLWIYNYKIPHGAIAVATNSGGTLKNDGLTTSAQISDSTDWHTKFADKFSDKVVSTADTYQSPNVSITLSYGSLDTGKKDTTENGNHTKYGTKIAYTIADIYVGDISCLKAGFAQDTYGIGYEEPLSDMSNRMKAVLAINGDSYNNNRHKDNGTIIRNGVMYRDKATSVETCVLHYDGTMKIYQPDEYTAKQLVDAGAYQSWIFGPSLLDENGKANKSFMTWNYIRESHPRTAIGYYEPGHYCFVVVDGRQKDYSRGMFLEEEAQLFEQLGCKIAYNLDGGHTSFMLKEGKTVSHPYKPDHKVPDGIFIMEQ